MSQKWFNNIDLQQNELQNGVIQNLAGDPTSGKAGQIYYNTVDKGYRYHNGSAWVNITSVTAGDGLTGGGTSAVTISLGDPSASGSGSNTYGSNDVTAESHTHQIKLPDASTSTKGVIELATDAEATAGTDTTRAINAKQLAAAKQSAIDSAKVTIQTSNGITGGSTTPGNSFTLSGVNASTKAKGVIRIATQAEVNGGSSNDSVVTPMTLRKGGDNGVASLDANGKIILSQIPDAVYGNVLYGGNLTEFTEEDLAASVNISSSLRARLGLADTVTTITIANATSSSITGEYGYASLEGVYFICEVAGSWGLTGSFEVGDWMISTGTSWQKVDNTDAVKSVNGQTGNVNITKVNEAGTADKLKTARTIALKGDATGSTTFDGSANKDINVTLANTGVTAGTYNNVTVDAKGRVVSASNIKTSVVSEITGNGTQKEFDIAHSLGKNVIVQVFLNGQQIGSDTADELVGVDVYTTNEKVKLVFATPPSTSQKFKVVISSGGNGVESLTPTAADDNKVAIADSTAATGWKFGKIKTENLENGKVERAEYLSGWARHFVTVLLSKGSGASYSDFRIFLEVFTRSFEQITTMSQLIAAVRSSGSVVLATGVGYVGTGAGIPDAYYIREDILENRVYNVLRVFYEEHITAASCCVSIVKTTVSNISSEGFDVNTVTMNAFDDIFISDMVSTLLAG